MQISAKSDYAVRALLSLAAHAPDLVKVDVVVGEQGLPRKFVEVILGELRRAGLVRSQRGADGGYALNRPAAEITIGSVIRAVDGPLAEVRDQSLSAMTYTGAAEDLPVVWMAVRAVLRRVLETTTIADLAAGELPAAVTDLADEYRSATRAR